MGKTRAVLDVLPSVYGAGDQGKLLAAVIDALAIPLEAADGELFRIQQAHRLMVAPQTRDVRNLAAVLDLQDVHFQDLLETGIDGQSRLQMMRRRVRRIANLHLDGLGTPRAVVDAAAALLGGELVADGDGEPLLRPLDREGYSHRATIEFPFTPGRPRETIVLHENPFRRLKVDPAARWLGDRWAADNGNPDVSPVRAIIRGVGDRTVMPTLYCPDVPGGLVFNGVVPDGETLVIDPHDGATIGRLDVTPWLVTYAGGMYDHVDADGAAFAVGDGTEREAFIGGVDADDASPWRSPSPALPRPPLGRSHWHLGVNEGIFDADDLDLAVFAAHEAPVGVFDDDPPFDACVFDVPPSAVVGMAWDERVACAFKLLLPAHTPSPGGSAAPTDHSARISALLPRFRAAGVRAFVETADDGWELGRGVLRPADATDGEGIEFHTVRLVDRAAESLVPFDPGGEVAATRTEER